jgi:hypothetical protein
MLPSNFLPYPLATDDILLFLTFRPSLRLHTQHIPTLSSSDPVNVKLDNDRCYDCVVKIAPNAGERSSETKSNHLCRVHSQSDKGSLIESQTLTTKSDTYVLEGLLCLSLHTIPALWHPQQL